MTHAQQIELTHLEIKEARRQFAEECKAMLEEMAKYACSCKPTDDGVVHDPRCQRFGFLRSAHAVWMKGMP